MAKETGRKLIAQNKTARHDYFIEDVYECGLVLTGTEVKSLRAGRATLTDGFANSKDGELWLSGIHIPEYNEGSWTNHLPRRDRKLLLHKREIEKLTDILKQGGLTIVPLSLYFKDGKAKVEIAVAKGKKAHDKRNTLKEKEASREVDREISRRISGKSDRTGGRVAKAMGIKKGGKSRKSGGAGKSGGSKLSGKSARYADYD
jgi:SsrA-binding protein